MTTLLILAYHFPPLGGAGSQRWLKLVRHPTEGRLRYAKFRVLEHGTGPRPRST